MGTNLHRAPARLLWMAGLCAASLFCFVKEAHTGTYGEQTQEFSGYRISINTSVGYWSDHAAEAEAFKSREQAARRALTERDADLKRMGRHFRTGSHPYVQRRGLLQDKPTPNASMPILMLRLLNPVTGAAGKLPLLPSLDTLPEMRVQLFTKPEARGAVLDKLVADFAASQLAKGGILDAPTPGSYTDNGPVAVQARLAANVYFAPLTHHIAELLHAVRENETFVRILAGQKTPALLPVNPPPQPWEQQNAQVGWIVAQVVVAVIDQKPYTPELWTRLQTLPEEHFSKVLRLMVLLLPDDQWQGGLTAAKAALATKKSADKALQDWLAELAPNPQK